MAERRWSARNSAKVMHQLLNWMEVADQQRIFFLVAAVEWLCRALMVRNKQSDQQEGGRIEEIVWIQLVFPYELRNQRENEDNLGG